MRFYLEFSSLSTSDRNVLGAQLIHCVHVPENEAPYLKVSVGKVFNEARRNAHQTLAALRGEQVSDRTHLCNCFATTSLPSAAEGQLNKWPDPQMVLSPHYNHFEANVETVAWNTMGEKVKNRDLSTTFLGGTPVILEASYKLWVHPYFVYRSRVRASHRQIPVGTWSLIEGVISQITSTRSP